MLHQLLLQVQRMRVDVETGSQLTAGQTVCDVWGRSGLPANVDVARRVSGPSPFRALCAALLHAYMRHAGHAATSTGETISNAQRMVGGLKADCSGVQKSGFELFKWMLRVDRWLASGRRSAR